MYNKIDYNYMPSTQNRCSRSTGPAIDLFCLSQGLETSSTLMTSGGWLKEKVNLILSANLDS